MCDRLTRLMGGALALSFVLGGMAGGADRSLVGWWKLDDNARDSSGNGHDGVLYGGPEWVEGAIGRALKFDGVDDRVEMPGTSPAAGFTTVSGEVTWTMWIKASPSSATQSIMALGPAGAAHVQGNRSVNVEVSGVVMVRAHSVAALTSLNSTATVNDDQWHHIAVTIAFETNGTNDSMKVYIDGDPGKGYETGAVNINQYAGAAANFIVTLGARAGSPFGGSLDDVRIYNRVLAEDEIQYLIESGGQPYPFASGPTPADGSMLEQTFTTLKWRPGDFAASHNVYFGGSFDDVNAATPGSEGLFLGSTKDNSRIVGMPQAMAPGATYYWRVDEVNDAEPGSPWKGRVWSFWIRPAVAWDPVPADGAPFALLDPPLSWKPGLGVLFHTVYFGASLDEVTNAVTGGVMGVNASYKPPTLKPDTTYYWRVDEFAPTGTSKGPVWSFRTVPEILVEDKTLLGWWKMEEADSGMAIDWSGHGLHGTAAGKPRQVDGVAGYAAQLNGSSDFFTTPVPSAVTMNTATMTAWIKPTKVHGWAGIIFSRGAGTSIGGFGLKAGNQLSYTWNNVAATYNFNSNLVVPMNEWSFVAAAIEADKATLYLDGVDVSSTNVITHAPITFTAGIGLGNDPTAGRSFGGALDDLRLYTRALTASEIKQVMAAGAKPAAVEDPAMIENFDGYNAYLGQAGPDVWDVWSDGYGGNGTGSSTGYPAEPFMERIIVAANRGQSLPLGYDNTGSFMDLNGKRVSKTISEISRTFSPALDLTTGKATRLVLQIRGLAANTVQPTDNAYLVLEDGAKTDEILLLASADMQKTVWKKTQIDLSTLTVNRARITKITLGVGNRTAPQIGGTGTIYIDEIARE